MVPKDQSADMVSPAIGMALMPRIMLAEDHQKPIESTPSAISATELGCEKTDRFCCV